MPYCLDLHEVAPMVVVVTVDVVSPVISDAVLDSSSPYTPDCTVLCLIQIPNLIAGTYPPISDSGVLNVASGCIRACQNTVPQF